MRRLLAASAAALALSLACGAAPQAAAPAASPSRSGPGGARIEGVVRTTLGDQVTLADGTSFELTRTTRITQVRPATAADLKPGLFVAITAKPQADGTLLASIVSVFPDSLKTAIQPGQRPLGE